MPVKFLDGTPETLKEGETYLILNSQLDWGLADLARKIKEVARENDIEIVENKPLARALYANVDVGAPIPQELYQAVAEVLAYVYKLKDKIS